MQYFVTCIDALQIAANISPTLTRFASRCRVQVLGVDLPLSVVKSIVINLDVSILFNIVATGLALDNWHKGYSILSLRNDLFVVERLMIFPG